MSPFDLYKLGPVCFVALVFFKTRQGNGRSLIVPKLYPDAVHSQHVDNRKPLMGGLCNEICAFLLDCKPRRSSRFKAELATLYHKAALANGWRGD